MLKVTLKDVSTVVEGHEFKVGELDFNLEHEMSAQELNVVYDKLPKCILKIYDAIVDLVNATK